MGIGPYNVTINVAINTAPRAVKSVSERFDITLEFIDYFRAKEHPAAAAMNSGVLGETPSLSLLVTFLLNARKVTSPRAAAAAHMEGRCGHRPLQRVK